MTGRKEPTASGKVGSGSPEARCGGWAVAICEPGRDFEADLALRRHGWRVVFLCYRHLLTGHKRPGWRTATDYVARPLLSGYLFLELWPEQEWPDPRRVPWYAGLIRRGNVPLLMPEATVACWHRRVFDGEFDDRRPDEPPSDAKRPFRPATDPDARRRMLQERFAAMVGAG